jgi:hypothetical protein
MAQDNHNLCILELAGPFDQLDQAFEIMDKKLAGVIKPLIVF